MSQAEQLERLALAVQFLAPCRSDPEKFHTDKSEIVGALRRLAADMQRGPRNKRMRRSEK